jgi:PAS domain S-box-containing protein
MLEGYAHCRMEFEGDVARDWVYLDVNPAFSAITGIKDAVGKRVTEVIPGIRETNPELFELYGRVAQTGEPSQVESFVPALGIWFSLAVYCPAPGEFVAVFEDITERRRAFEELSRRERDLEEAQRIGRVGSYVLDVGAGRWSSSAVLDDLLGLGPDSDRSVAGWLAIVHPDDRAALAEYFQTEVLERRGRFDREYRIVRLNDRAERWVYGRGELTLDPAGSPTQMVGMIQDITERKRAEQEILDLNAALEKRVDERTAELAQAIADLERANKELQEDHAPRLDAEGRRLLGVVRSSTKGMGQLIDDLLAFSRAGRDEVQRSQVDMEALVRSAWESVTSPAERGTITFHLDALPAAECDPGLMRLVWTNLLANAVKFTATKPERTVEVRFRQEADRTTYVVQDNGVGFDPRYRDKLFGVFQRLHSTAEFEGTGVGLALAQRIVHRHGGEVRADSTLGQGATFFVTLPREGSTE